MVQVVMNLFGGRNPPVLEDRERLPYTTACILETIRCHPFAPVGMPHKTSADAKVGTLAIPKGAGVLFNIYAVNHDPNLWEDPEKFRPDRFLDPATGRLRQDAGPLHRGSAVVLSTVLQVWI